MNSDQESKPRIAKWKIGLILMLVSTLASTLAEPLFVGKPAENATETESPKRNRRGRPAATAKSVPTVRKLAPRPTIDIKLDDVLSHDPFKFAADAAPLLVSADTAKEQKQDEEEELEAKKMADDKRESERALREALFRLRQDGVAMIIETASGRVARIGSRVVREGDKIDGFKVVRISTEGVVLSRDKVK